MYLYQVKLQKRIPQHNINFTYAQLVKVAYLLYCIQYDVLIIMIIKVTIIKIINNKNNNFAFWFVFFLFSFVNFLVLFVYCREECQPMHVFLY